MFYSMRRRICYIMMCILLLGGIYGTYTKADSLAQQAASMESACIYMEDKGTQTVERFSKIQSTAADAALCVVERINYVTRAILGRITARSSHVRRDIRFFCLFLWALCAAYFLLKCWCIEEILYLHETKYRAALIKYIHDIDGKKRVSCLT